MDTWEMIRTERAGLADAFAGLAPSDWDKPSLCTGWTVRQMVAHMIATARLTPPAFFGAMLLSGFNFTTMANRKIGQVIDGRTDADLVADFRSCVDKRTAPPGPALSWLGETIVHGEDVFRALDGYREHPVAHVLAVADFYKDSNLIIGAKRRIEGLTLRATDADWSHGTGPEVTGPAIALVMAMTGRKVALDDLSGEGVAVLRGRS